LVPERQLGLPDKIGTPNGNALRPDVLSPLLFMAQSLGNPLPVGRS
jgi:hypothetical protein